MENGDTMIGIEKLRARLDPKKTVSGSCVLRLSEALAVLAALDELEAGRALFDELDFEKDEEPEPEAPLYRNARLTFDQARDRL